MEGHDHHGMEGHDHHHDMEAPSSKNTFFEDLPSPSDKAATARWLAHNTNWGAMSTITASTRGERSGTPFNNIASHSDGAPDSSTGTIYFLHSPLDASMKDVAENDKISFALSEAQTGYCAQQEIDAEDPRCARLSMSGRLVKVDDPDEIEIAKTAVFAKHPVMEKWFNPSSNNMHSFGFWKLELEEIWLIDFYGGAAIIGKEAWDRGTDNEGELVLPKFIIKSRSSTSRRSSEGHRNASTPQVLLFLTTVVAAFGFGLVFGHRKAAREESMKMLVEESPLELVEHATLT